MFKEILSDLEHEDLVYHCEAQWLRHADMLAWFNKLREEVKQSMEIKGFIVEFSDDKWPCDVVLMDNQVPVRAECQV